MGSMDQTYLTAITMIKIITYLLRETTTREESRRRRGMMTVTMTTRGVVRGTMGPPGSGRGRGRSLRTGPGPGRAATPRGTRRGYRSGRRWPRTRIDIETCAPASGKGWFLLFFVHFMSVFFFSPRFLCVCFFFVGLGGTLAIGVIVVDNEKRLLLYCCRRLLADVSGDEDDM